MVTEKQFDKCAKEKIDKSDLAEMVESIDFLEKAICGLSDLTTDFKGALHIPIDCDCKSCEVGPDNFKNDICRLSNIIQGLQSRIIGIHREIQDLKEIFG